MTDRPYWNREMETIGDEALHALEADRLRHQLDWVWERSPLYRKKYTEVGIDVAEIDRDSLDRKSVV